MAEDQLRLNVEVPVNTRATVVLPITGDGITEGGLAGENSSGVIPVKSAGSSPRFEVGSGHYSFAATLQDP